MTGISDIASLGATPPGTVGSSLDSVGALAEDFDQFLSLLTTQLQNQDPLEPLDNNELTNQIVQFTQVEQQIQTNDTLEDIRDLSNLTVTDVGLGFVGLDVELTGDTFAFDGANPVNLGYILPTTAAEAQVTIRDDSGDSVFTFEGDTTVGLNTFTFDGRNQEGFLLPPGNYTIDVAAEGLDGTFLITPTSVPGRVTGIENDGNGNVSLLVGDQTLSISDITRATLPPQNATPPLPDLDI